MALRRLVLPERGAGARGPVERLRGIGAARLRAQQCLEGLGRGPRLPGGEEALPAQAQQLTPRDRIPASSIETFKQTQSSFYGLDERDRKQEPGTLLLRVQRRSRER